MKSLFFIASIFLLQNLALGQSSKINLENIDIVRDEWGVPHIFGKTDKEVAYGFAWAQAEDDFKTIQEMLLPIKGLAGVSIGKDGAAMDLLVHIIEAERVVNEKFEKDLSGDFIKYLDAYAAGINAYAKNFPDEVINKKLFPVNSKDVIQGFVLGMTLMASVHKDIIKLFTNKVEAIDLPQAEGSNAFAFSKRKTTDNKTYLAINSHQPLEGPYSWYEAHLVSDEGLNILGATFVGSPVISVGTNEDLGWGHTVNHADFSDIFQLEMHPSKKGAYKVDGQYLTLENYHTKLRIKLFKFLPFGIKKKFYKSIYGTTFKTKSGYYAIRFPANMEIRSAEQWFEMGKSENFSQFKKALKLQAHASLNIVYADKDDHIFYLGNGLLPKRNPKYDWKNIVPGNTRATLWNADFYPLDSLPQVDNPPSGYVYNCNHTPFLSSAKADNPDYKKVPFTTGYQPPEQLTNRAVRFYELVKDLEQIDYEKFKEIKYDMAYHKPMHSSPLLEKIFHLDASKYPELSESIKLLNDWDRVADLDSEGASLFILCLRNIWPKITEPNWWREGDVLNESLLVESIRLARKHCKKHFKRYHVPLREMQRHSRGNVNLPVEGGPDVLAAMYAKPIKKGQFRASAGDSYIQLVRFSAEGPEIESVHAYGASAKENSLHATDQMQLFVDQKLKKMTLDREAIYESAKEIYHPK
ncbi:MAG: penicillin acylase family protein [Bacteroidota bacterium]